MTCSTLQQQIREVYQMNRERCIESLIHFEKIPVDFTREYLQPLALEQLQHYLVAALITVENRKYSHRRAG